MSLKEEFLTGAKTTLIVMGLSTTGAFAVKLPIDVTFKVGGILGLVTALGQHHIRCVKDAHKYRTGKATYFISKQPKALDLA